MMHIVRKAFMDFEKEEKFLNDMSTKGLALADYSWCKYVFDEAPREKYVYRIELLEHPINHPESKEYIRFMEETGAELVTSYHRWVYFRKKAEDGEFVIYSDLDSRMKHYNRILMFFILVTAFNAFIGAFNYYVGFVQDSNGLASINSYIAIISFAFVALLIIFIILPLVNKLEKLKKEKQIKE